MKKLRAYEDNSEKILELIYKSKKSIINDGKEKYKVKTIIEDNYEKIIQSYSYYNNNKHQLENIGESICGELEKHAMIHCYENSTKQLELLKKNIKMNQSRDTSSICNYCGINNINTFDHYLPKSEYPEFSVYGPNLIPCCGECNNKKGELWRSVDSKRYFFNLYYDEIPTIQFIEAIITIENNEPKIEFQFINNSGVLEYANLKNGFIIKNHYIKLNLLERFRDACNSYIGEIINSLTAHKKYEKEEIVGFLSEEYSAILATYGINNWKSITLIGMLKSEDFIEYCTCV